MIERAAISTIVLVNDEWIEREEMYGSALRKAFSKVDVVTLATEHEFMERLPELANLRGYRVVVTDLMMPWVYPEPNFPAVPEDYFSTDGSARAGIRIARLLAANANTRDIDVIIHTHSSLDLILENMGLTLPEINPNAHFLGKHGASILVETVKGLVLKNNSRAS